MTQPTFDARAFLDFERSANSRNASSYNDLFSAVTDRAIVPLLDAARVGAGTRLVDVAAGPGRLVEAGARRGAHAVGVDLAPEMIALARTLRPALEFREGSADALPFPDRSFDALTCAFGLGHFPDPPRAVAQFHRVLAPGGVAALAWWDTHERNRINGVFHETIMRLKVAAPAAVPPGPPFDRYSDPAELTQLLEAAGFTAIRVASVAFTHTIRDIDALWTMAMGSFARVGPVIMGRATPGSARSDLRSAKPLCATPARMGWQFRLRFWSRRACGPDATGSPSPGSPPAPCGRPPSR